MATHMKPDPGGDELRAAIAALWRDARPRTLARIETIERAVAALRSGSLDRDLADRARGDAHKLAGSLGTFGMPQATDHARAVERGLEDGAAPSAADELEAHARALRRMVEDAGG